jgi:hypothetical protein
MQKGKVGEEVDKGVDKKQNKEIPKKKINNISTYQ